MASLTMLNLHAPSVYGNLGPFFDEVVADKAWGTWDDLLAALRDDEDGPQLDSRERDSGPPEESRICHGDRIATGHAAFSASPARVSDVRSTVVEGWSSEGHAG